MDPLSLLCTDLGLDPTAYATQEEAYKACSEKIEELIEMAASNTNNPDYQKQLADANELLSKSNLLTKAIATMLECADTPEAISEGLKKVVAKAKETPAPTDKKKDDVAPPVDLSKYVPVDEFQKVVARCDSLEKIQATNKREIFIKNGMTLGKIVASTKENWETVYDVDPAVAAERLEKAPILLATEQLTNTDAPPVGGTRKAVIASASTEFDTNAKKEKWFTTITTKPEWCNDKLREKGLAKLSDAEKSELETTTSN